MSTPEVPNIPPAPGPGGMQFEPMPEKPTPTNIIETLLKHPDRIVHELHHQRDANLSLTLLVVAMLGVALYGVVVGSLSGGLQIVIAPAKTAVGILAAGLICLPSLYIFFALPESMRASAQWPAPSAPRSALPPCC